MKNSNIKKLNACPMCSYDGDLLASYLENRRYRVECLNCGQWFEFNAPSQLAADLIWNQTIAKENVNG